MSGVTVPTTIKPMSSGVSPAFAIALQRRLLAEIRGRDARIDDVALADAGALQNPLVGGVDHLLEIGVGQHARRHVGRQRRDRRRPSAACAARSVGSRHHSRESLRSAGASSPK